MSVLMQMSAKYSKMFISSIGSSFMYTSALPDGVDHMGWGLHWISSFSPSLSRARRAIYFQLDWSL